MISVRNEKSVLYKQETMLGYFGEEKSKWQYINLWN